MNKIIILFIILINFISNLNADDLSNFNLNNEKGYPSVKTLVEFLNNLEDYKFECRKIHKYVLKKDEAEFKFESGSLIFLPKINNGKRIVLFLGSGKFHFTPPTKIEKEQLYRHYETSQYQLEFKRVFIYSDDQTIENLYNASKQSEYRNVYEIKKVLKNCSEYMSYMDYSHVRDIMFAILNQQNPGLFYAQINPDDFHPVFYIINPYKEEPVRFMRRIDPKYFYNLPEVICQFDTENKYNIPAKYKVLNINNYYINSLIEENLDYSATAEVELEIIDKNIDWSYLDLYYYFNIDSIVWSDGTIVPFFKEYEKRTVWIYLDEESKSRKNQKLIFHYHGELLEQQDAGIYMKSPSLWYPRNLRNNTYSNFELNFTYPKELTLISVGKKLNTTTLENALHSNWLTFNPLYNASFNIGDYNKLEIINNNLPTVKIYDSKNKSDFYGLPFGILKIDRLKENEGKVSRDIVKSLYFYKNIFGSTPINELYVTETPYAHGMAYSGLLHLGKFTFHRTMAFDIIFRAHEVAHQWWGIAVDHDTYHDQWITEGMATFLGLWYMQSMLNASDEYLNVLNQWKNEILNNRKFPFKDGTEAGPIWLGYRTATTTTENDFNLLIYKKSAWIFHMLRNYMIDFENMKEDKFKNMLRDAYHSNKDSKITTEKLKKIIEKHTNQNMDWFFGQWIYGTNIPNYKVKYKIINGPNRNHFSLLLYVEQTNVDNDFQMYIPIRLEHDNVTIHHERLLIKGSISSFLIPNLPAFPSKVIFNDYNSVLCEFEMEKWE